MKIKLISLMAALASARTKKVKNFRDENLDNQQMLDFLDNHGFRNRLMDKNVESAPMVSSQWHDG